MAAHGTVLANNCGLIMKGHCTRCLTRLCALGNRCFCIGNCERRHFETLPQAGASVIPDFGWKHKALRLDARETK